MESLENEQEAVLESGGNENGGLAMENLELLDRDLATIASKSIDSGLDDDESIRTEHLEPIGKEEVVVAAENLVPGISLEDLDPEVSRVGYDDASQDYMSQVSFDSAQYASLQGMSQWELFLKIADEKRGILPGGESMSVSMAESTQESQSQFTLQEKEEMEATQENLRFQIDSLQERIKRRNVLIGTIRQAYLKDVVELKTVMFSVLTESERKRVVSQWEDNLPSLDLRTPIELSAPGECEFTFTPCVTCGGTVEIFHRQSSRMNKLEKSLAEYRKKQDELIATTASQKVMLDRSEMHKKETERVHNDEKKFMYNELKQAKGVILEKEKDIDNLKMRNRHLNDENNQLKADNKDMIEIKKELNQTEKELFKQTENNKILTERVERHEHKINDLEEEADVTHFLMFIAKNIHLQ